MNDVNINQFQFEYDLTWMSFFQNHKGKTYMRYGGREDAGPETHLTKVSLVNAMKKTLELHKAGQARPATEYEPAGESSSTPNQNPFIQKVIAKRQNKCIHCHEVKTGKLGMLRDEGKLEKKMVFTYPSPRNLGIVLDSDSQNLVSKVLTKSAAEKANLKAGDKIKTANGQSVFTYADMTRVLELAPETGTLKILVDRGGKEFASKLTLSSGWRTMGDPSWRESGHVVGPSTGFWGVKQSDSQKQKLRIKSDQMAIKATAIWGHWAKKAKIKHGDIVTSIDGKKDDFSIKQLQSYVHMNKDWGDPFTITVLRKGRPMELKFVTPNKPQH